MRSTAVSLALLGIAAGAPLAAQNAQGAFVVTLGHDTIVAERYKRTAPPWKATCWSAVPP